MAAATFPNVHVAASTYIHYLKQVYLNRNLHHWKGAKSNDISPSTTSLLEASHHKESKRLSSFHPYGLLPCLAGLAVHGERFADTIFPRSFCSREYFGGVLVISFSICSLK